MSDFFQAWQRVHEMQFAVVANENIPLAWNAIFEIFCGK